MSFSKFCQDQTTILQEDLRGVFAQMLSSCMGVDADFSVVESAVKSAFEIVRSTLVSRGLDISIRCSPHRYLCPQCGEALTLWNLSGDFGIFDSGRADVSYENFRGRKLDRKMLELLREDLES